MDSEHVEVEQTVEQKQEAALDTLYPKSAAPSGDVPAEATTVGDVEEKELRLSEQIQNLRKLLSCKVEKINIANTKDGSQTNSAGVHGTRLMSNFRVVDAELERFAKFLDAEGHE